MDTSQRISALIAYLPVIGWLYVYIFQRKNILATFHLRQSIGLILFLVIVFLAWVVASWVSGWIPYGMILVSAFFTLVMTALVFSVVAWVMGVINALRGRMALLPLFGRAANRMPF
jgi:uncharacterized membrane protein